MPRISARAAPARTAPGVVRRLWDARDRLRPHREPEIHRVDLSATAARRHRVGRRSARSSSGSNVPRTIGSTSALALLERLGAIDAGALTEIGRAMQRLPLHPRLARMLVAANGAWQIAQACAMLSERHMLAPRDVRVDVRSVIRHRSVGEHAAARQTGRAVRRLRLSACTEGCGETRRSALRARRRRPDDTGDGALRVRLPPRRLCRLSRSRRRSGASRNRRACCCPRARARSSRRRAASSTASFIVALDVQASTRPNDPDARIRLASLVDREWLEPTSVEIVHRFDDSRGRVKAVEVERYDALTLSETPVDVEPDQRATMLAGAWSSASRTTRTRSCCAGCDSPASRSGATSWLVEPRQPRVRWATSTSPAR